MMIIVPNVLHFHLWLPLLLMVTMTGANIGVPLPWRLCVALARACAELGEAEEAKTLRRRMLAAGNDAANFRKEMQWETPGL